jgi:PAS domain S-box-containing protein
MRILNVDDKADNLYLMESMLRGYGYEVVGALNGIEALQKLEDQQFDMIISDILMPKMDGFQLCREVKKNDKLKKIPFVFYTATYTDKKDEDLALSLGASGFIIKPTEPEKFMEIITTLIHEHKEGRLPVPRPVLEEEIYLKAYNVSLIHKLEDKLEQIEATNRELEVALNEKSKEIATRKQAEDELKKHRDALEDLVKDRTDELMKANEQLKKELQVRKQAEEALRESEERYRITLQSMPDAVSIIRIEDFRYLYVNDAFCKITEYTLEEVKGRTPFDLNLPATPDGLDHYLDLIKNNESLDSLEQKCRKKDGTVIDTLVSARPVHYGGEDCFVMVIADITALKEIEEERKRLEIQSQKMESIGTLASGIAHDFNNILTSIIGYTQMSMKDILSLTKGEKDISVVRSDLNEVRNAAHRARDLVNHILAFSRHAEKDFVPIDLCSTIRESLKVLRPTLPSNIKIHENLIDTHLIQGDPEQIHQVLTNLCTNAAHAMDKTGGELEVSLQRVIIDDALDIDVTPGPYLRLSVGDTGPGMTAKVMTRIFDPYFTTKWKGHGTGLGLSIVHGIVKSHGGAISCNTAPGKGTTFDIYLPEYEFSKEDGETKAEVIHAIGDKRILDLDENLTRKNLKGKKKGDLRIHSKNK